MKCWEIDGHRVVNGDASDPAAYDLALGTKRRAKCIFTDPLYGVNYMGKQKKRKLIANDDGFEFHRFLKSTLGAALRRTAGAFYVCMSDLRAAMAKAVIEGEGVYLGQTIVWVKHRFVLSRADYHNQYELILYGWTQGHHRWHGDRKQSNVWFIKSPKASADHPTMKPIELCAKGIINSTAAGEIVLDPFAGSGSTGVACAETGRRAALIELDAEYAAVCVRRLEKATGVKAKPVRD